MYLMLFNEDMLDDGFQHFEGIVNSAPQGLDLMRASQGEKNILQLATMRGLVKHVRCLLAYPGK